MLVFLYGKDAYRVKQNTDKIVGEYLAKYPAGMGVTRFNLEESAEFQRLEEAIKTVGLFAEKKLLVVKNGFTEADPIGGKNPLRTLAASNGARTVLELIEKWELVEDKERIIVLVENNSEIELKKKDKKLFALLTAKPSVAKEFKPLAGKQLESWLGREAEGLGVKLEPAAARALVAAAGNDPIGGKNPLRARAASNGASSWRLRLELEKLANYAQGKAVTLADVDTLVPKPLEQNIFNTIDALGARDRSRTLTLLARHLADGADPHYLFSMFVYQFRNLLAVKAANGQAPAGMHPYVARKLGQQAQQFGLDELKQKFTALAAADLAIKSGQQDIVDFLYAFALS